MASRQFSQAQQPPAGSVLLVIHDFIARSPDELSLAKGDRIELIERDDDFGDGWFLGRHMNNGATGLFPEVYTTPAPKGTLPSAARQVSGNQVPTNALKGKQSLDALSSIQSIGANNIYTVNEPQRPSSSGGGPSDAPRGSISATAQPVRNSPQPGSHNSVMHETLSVIDEHITGMRSAPQQSYTSNGTGRELHDNRPAYGSQAGRRLSYINGHETDEEEAGAHTEDEVMAWTPLRVAEYLEDNGVDPEHCHVFKEQEISGEVLLHMEQSAIFIKEFELGSVGRRLKTWQKVKALQDEVRAATVPGAARSESDYSGGEDDEPRHLARKAATPVSASPSRQATTTSYRNIQPDRSPGMPQQSMSSMNSPLQTMTLMTSRPESNVRPSAASIRSLNHNHSRRHSSLGSIGPDRTSATLNRSSVHGQPTAPALAAATAARRVSAAQDNTFSSSPSRYDGQSVADFGFGTSSSRTDLDRGYFSGNELDNRNKRGVLQKKSSPSHARTASAATDSTRHSASYKTHGRIPSTDSNQAINSAAPPPSTGMFGFLKTGSNRSVSSPQTGGKPTTVLSNPVSPIVTKLEYGKPITAAAGSETSSINPSPSPASQGFSFFGGKPRSAGGLRVASDAVTQNEKRTQSALKGSPITSPTRTGSTTPSTETHSIDIQKSDKQSRVSTGSSSALAPPAATSRSKPKPKDKKATSAYTRGLEKKTPAEQIAGCDYSGWMKKKSSNIVGSWKPRLFVLRGRRLSYYYSENDTEEKGLIDISSHRVLPAENEKITGLYAALTGASSGPTAPSNSTTQTSAAKDLAEKPPLHPTHDQALFIFKLVPPRQGLSKAVNFTKPTVHYFAVNSRQEGRLWMAALMKATIDYDANGKVTTSYNQETISLAKARARRERPPALKDAAENGDATMGPAELDGEGLLDDEDSTGLGIGGLDNAVAGAERPEDAASRTNGSVSSSYAGDAAAAAAAAMASAVTTPAVH